ncbi:MAG: ATP-binding protein [Chthoniobacteraceae bacterium]
MQPQNTYSLNKKSIDWFGWWTVNGASTSLRYIVAILSVAAALLIDEADLLTGGFRIYLVFYPFIVIATLFGGVGPGLLATVLSCLVATFYWVEPIGKLAIASRADVISMGIFVAGNLFFIWVCSRLRRALRLAAEIQIHQTHVLEMERQTQVLKQSEQELLRREQILNDAQRLTHVGCWQWDVPTDMTTWSDELFKIFGRDPKLPPPGYREFTAIFTPESSARLDAAVNHALETGTSYDLSLEFIDSGGTRRWVTGGGEAVRSPAGKVIQLLGTTQDITAQKQIEEALRASECFGRSVRDSLIENLAVIDKAGTIIAVNRAWKQFALENGAPDLAENSEGMNYLAICEKAPNYPNGKEAAAARSGILAVMNGEKSEFSLEYPCHAPGKQRWFQMHVSPLKGSRKGAVIAHLDTTKSKEAENALLENKEALETANQVKAQFIAVLSHELRTPLTPVLAVVSELKDHSDLSPEMQISIDLIHRNIEMEKILIDDLLDVTRINSGKISMQPQTVDAQVCLEAALTISRQDIEAKHIRLTMSPPADLHHVWADPTRLQQVFWNILRNATKFTPEGGEIRVVTSNANGRLRIEITDTGIGIPPEVLPRIFNAFEQGEKTTTQFFGGLGLGLSIAKTVVEMHHGRIIAFSKGRGKGATFAVELDTVAAVVPESARPPAPSTAIPERVLSILLVEDHADTLATLARLLVRLGYNVTTATNIKTALDLAMKDHFDLLISDLGLPDGNGLDLIREIRKLHDLRGIALSGYGTEEDVRQSRDAGFDRHLTKPIRFETLRESIKQVMLATD